MPDGTLIRPSSTATWQVPLLVALATWAVSQVVPLVSPLILALAVGAMVANSTLADVSSVRACRDATTLMLRVGVALLGLRLVVSDVADLGLFAVLLVVVTVVTTFQVTRVVGVRLGLDPQLVSLLASGFAVCGAAAIAAVQDSVKAKEYVVGLAVALVTIHGTVMLAVIPLLGESLRLDDDTIALWAGASIHEVAQVAAAAALIGPGALAVAMSIKLGRVLMLAPVHRVVTRLHHTGSASPAHGIPWFLYAFVAAVLLRATGLVPDEVLTVAHHGSTVLLAAGMFGLGLGVVLKDLWPIPGRAVALSLMATLTVTSVPLVLLMLAGPSSSP